MEKFKVNGKLEIIHRDGQPYGIRDERGYLMFFHKVSKYSSQEDRYIEEIHEMFLLATQIYNALK